MYENNGMTYEELARVIKRLEEEFGESLQLSIYGDAIFNLVEGMRHLKFKNIRVNRNFLTLPCVGIEWEEPATPGEAKYYYNEHYSRFLSDV